MLKPLMLPTWYTDREFANAGCLITTHLAPHGQRVENAPL